MLLIIAADPTAKKSVANPAWVSVLEELLPQIKS